MEKSRAVYTESARKSVSVWMLQAFCRIFILMLNLLFSSVYSNLDDFCANYMHKSWEESGWHGLRSRLCCYIWSYSISMLALSRLNTNSKSICSLSWWFMGNLKFSRLIFFSFSTLSTCYFEFSHFLTLSNLWHFFRYFFFTFLKKSFFRW